MIREVTMYQVVCDACGKTAHEGGDYSAWTDEASAYEDGILNDWLMTDDGDWCWGCAVVDDEGNVSPPEKKESPDGTDDL